MKLIRSIANRLGFVHKSEVRSDPGFHAAALSRIFNDWTTSTLSADSALRKDLPKLRARCRQLREDNDYAKKFLTMLRSNVLGRRGFHFRNKAKDPDTVQGGQVIPGKADKFANKIIEDNFWEWGKAENCTVTRQMTWLDVQKLTLNTWGTDGECIIRKVRGFDNPFKFALQILETDYLDIELNKSSDARGNEIRMGIELNKWKQPVAYWFLSDNPNDSYQWNGLPMAPRYIQVPARDIIHPFTFDRPEQTRGVPPMSTPMSHMKMLGGYEEAAMTGARVGACQMGFMQRETPDAYTGGETDAAGNPVMDAEPGQIPVLPPGFKFQAFNPDYPNVAYGEFMKACLRSVASGLGVSYNTLANDMESVNFASGKLGLGEERDMWMTVQEWYIDRVCNPIFTDWLETQILFGKIPLPMSKFAKFNAPFWVGRRWGLGVNPVQEIQAIEKRLGLRLTSHSDELAELGIDRDELFDQIAEDKEAMASRDIEPKDVFPTEFAPEPEAEPTVEGGEGAESETSTKAQETGEIANAYGVGVRAGAITPNEDDENYFRARLGLPKKNSNVSKAWKEDEGIRRPITLIQKGIGPNGQPLQPPTDEDNPKSNGATQKPRSPVGA